MQAGVKFVSAEHVIFDLQREERSAAARRARLARTSVRWRIVTGGAKRNDSLMIDLNTASPV